MRNIFHADLFGLGVGLGVIVAIRQAQAARARKGDLTRGIRVILARAEAEQHAEILGQVLARQQLRKIRHRLQPANGRQFLAQRTGPGLLHGRFIHARREEVADLPLHRRARRVRLGGILQNAP